ncbi:UNVERIFIED_CONTAM: hypothetical protein Sradi_6995800 [Sesamum radiatum]|uniref:Uncharacterized protein n=1 Tax=Sesamum radiatum TaxID=300843 RepID=A0AAW2JFJ1_SESRA
METSSNSWPKKPVFKCDALLARATKYINMEDAQAAKKESRREKRKEIKEENPSKKPRIYIRDKKPPFQRLNVVYTPLTVPITQAFIAVEEKGLLTRPRGALGRRSPSPRKSQIREAHDISLKEVIEVEAMEDTPLIQFGRAERSRSRTSHNDALVITAVLTDYEVGYIIIDLGSSANILFGEAYDEMQLGDVSLEKVNTSLHGFAGEVVHPRGMISLPLTMGAGTTQKTRMLKFLVVDMPSAYNVILGRPTLTAFQAVISIYHMKIKFPTPGGVEVQGNPLQSRKCYVEAVRKGQKRNLDEDHQGVPSSKKGK